MSLFLNWIRPERPISNSEPITVFRCAFTIEGVAVSGASARLIVDFAILATSQLAAIQVTAGFYACAGALAALIVALQGSEFTFAWLDNNGAFGQLQTIDYNYKGRTSMVDPGDIGGMTYVGELLGDHSALGC
jgi:hypothetical protein